MRKSARCCGIDPERGFSPSVTYGDSSLQAVAPLQRFAGATSPRSDLKNRRGAAETRFAGIRCVRQREPRGTTGVLSLRPRCAARAARQRTQWNGNRAPRLPHQGKAGDGTRFRASTCTGNRLREAGGGREPHAILLRRLIQLGGAADCANRPAPCTIRLGAGFARVLLHFIPLRLHAQVRFREPLQSRPLPAIRWLRPPLRSEPDRSRSPTRTI